MRENTVGFQKHHIGILLLTLMIFSGCGAAMSYVSPTADFSYIKKIAVAPIQNLSEDEYADRKVMNVVATEVLRRGVFDVVEFGEVIRVLNEEGMKKDNLITKTIAERAGKRLDVEAMLIGSVMKYGITQSGRSSYPEVSVSLKLVDVASYSILWEATHSVKGANVFKRMLGVDNDSPDELCRQVVTEVFETLF